MAIAEQVLIVGELVVDYTLGQHGGMSKLRLGGVAHAARGLWAAGIRYSVAAFCPAYMVEQATQYLSSLECDEFVWLGDVVGAPNVVVIGDVKEIADQGYEDLMRETKRLKFNDPLPSLHTYSKVVIFPGRFELQDLAPAFSPEARFSIDVAYDLDDLSSLMPFQSRLDAIVISTSSSLFLRLGHSDVDGLLASVRSLSPEVLLLKENRGGSRLFELKSGEVVEIPATLGITVNSVGVGDVYSSVMVAYSQKGWVEAAWRGCQAATVYSGTTFPDDFRRDLQRELRLSLSTLKALGGTSLPWHDRPNYPIYLAGPDFSYVEKLELDQAVASLAYHNFQVRRPILENGELVRPATESALRATYHMDCELLRKCSTVFAVPLDRDAGTLVEIGMAIEMGKKVVTYDPRRENVNTMVVVGSSIFSHDLDTCLNGIFTATAELRRESR